MDAAIGIFRKVANAEDRVARSYFRKYLILSDMDRTEEASEALAAARHLRQTLTGEEGDDTMEVYDNLVCYENK